MKIKYGLKKFNSFSLYKRSQRIKLREREKVAKL